MLSKIITSLSLLWFLTNGQCADFGKTPHTLTGTHNYFIDTFNGNPFAYAINKCTSISLFDSKYYKYTCNKNSNSKWVVTKLQYTAADCSGTATNLGSYVEGNYTAGLMGYFSCAGDNTHVKVYIDSQTGCATGKDVYAGLQGCVNLNTTESKAFCNSTEAELQFYINEGGMCTSGTYCFKWLFQTTCAKIATVSGNAVYGKFEECYSVVTTVAATTTTMKPSSVSGKIAVFNIILALIVSLVWFL